MSLKSFDKFCETMITAKPGSKQEIFDERQKQIQTHLVIQSMVLFILMMLAHCVISDIFYKWSESTLFPFLLFAMICVIFYIIKAGVKGCYVGVNGGKGRYFPAYMCILIGVTNSFRTFFELEKDHFAIVRNGVVNDNFLEICSFVLMMLSGILTIIFIKKNANENKEQS